MYSLTQLMEMNLVTLRAMCVKAGITGMSKKVKDVVVGALVKHYASQNNVEQTNNQTNAKVKVDNLNVNLAKNYQSLQNTKITVSCGASSQDFPVVGKSIGYVTSILTDVLNIPVMAKILVNGSIVNSNYVLKDGDSVEYIKEGGKKG